jgi:hypothetical protein
MRFLMRYFDSLTNPLFKQDAEGRHVFFPMGVLAAGRTLPDADAAEVMRRRVRGMYMAFFCVVIPIVGGAAGVIGRTDWRVSIGFGLVAGLLMSGCMLYLARGLPRSDVRLTLGEAQQAQSRALGRGWIKTLLVMSSVFVAGGMAMALIETGSSRLMGLFAAVFFAACAAVFWRQLRMLSEGDAEVR